MAHKRKNDDNNVEVRTRPHILDFLRGLIVGGAVGAGVALILAPRSGPDTRARLMDKGIEIKEQVEHQVKHTRSQAEEAIHHARSQAEGAIEDARNKARQLEQNTRAATRAAQEAWRENNNALSS